MSTIRTIGRLPQPVKARPAGSRWLFVLVEVSRRIEVMAERSRGRRALFALNDAQLKDIGLSRSQAFREASRRFWE